ncbi:MAG: hypothetical protein ABI369_15635 [Acetobacteraceae bacterium]
MPEDTRLRVAAAQIACREADVAANLDMHLAAIEAARPATRPSP